MQKICMRNTITAISPPPPLAFALPSSSASPRVSRRRRSQIGQVYINLNGKRARSNDVLKVHAIRSDQSESAPPGCSRFRCAVAVSDSLPRVARGAFCARDQCQSARTLPRQRGAPVERRIPSGRHHCASHALTRGADRPQRGHQGGRGRGRGRGRLPAQHGQENQRVTPAWTSGPEALVAPSRRRVPLRHAAWMISRGS